MVGIICGELTLTFSSLAHFYQILSFKMYSLDGLTKSAQNFNHNILVIIFKYFKTKNN